MSDLVVHNFGLLGGPLENGVEMGIKEGNGLAVGEGELGF